MSHHITERVDARSSVHLSISFLAKSALSFRQRHHYLRITLYFQPSPAAAWIMHHAQQFHLPLSHAYSHVFEPWTSNRLPRHFIIMQMSPYFARWRDHHVKQASGAGLGLDPANQRRGIIWEPTRISR
ncbi:hypothetical protein FSOLCH5_004537 [Fusarium solani]